MSIQATLKSYYLIIKYIEGCTNRNHKPSKKEIMDKLRDEDLGKSDRTLDRNLEDIRDEFGIEIKYDKRLKGYYIDREESANLEYMLRFCEMSVSAQVIIESLKEGKEALQYIAFDSSDNLKGVHQLRNFLLAIRSNRMVCFEHSSFQKEGVNDYKIHPYLLKEYNRKWFIYGFWPEKQQFRIFGIDRISNMSLCDETFEPVKNFNPAAVFKDIVGISLKAFEDQPVQTIVISCDEEQGKYFKSLPWHSSFTVIRDTPQEFRFSVRLMPNYEFIQLMLKYCNRIQVLEPQWLREKMAQILSDAIAAYQ